MSCKMTGSYVGKSAVLCSSSVCLSLTMTGNVWCLLHSCFTSKQDFKIWATSSMVNMEGKHRLRGFAPLTSFIAVISSLFHQWLPLLTIAIFICCWFLGVYRKRLCCLLIAEASWECFRRLQVKSSNSKGGVGGYFREHNWSLTHSPLSFRGDGSDPLRWQRPGRHPAHHPRPLLWPNGAAGPRAGWR